MMLFGSFLSPVFDRQFLAAYRSSTVSRSFSQPTLSLPPLTQIREKDVHEDERVPERRLLGLSGSHSSMQLSPAIVLRHA